MTDNVQDRTRITPAQARWRCDPAALGYESTESLDPATRVLGQEDAVEALHFGLESRYRGNNIFVRGLSGFGRIALIKEVIEDISVDIPKPPDRCYVHNFDAPDQPRILTLPVGRGKEFTRLMDEFTEFVRSELPSFLSSDYIKTRERQLAATFQEKMKEFGQPFDDELQQAGLVMVPMQVGQNMIPVILPVMDGKPVQFDELQNRRLDGSMSEADFKQLMEKIAGFEDRLTELHSQIEEAQGSHRETLQKLITDETSTFVEARLHTIRSRFALPEVEAFLEQVKHDLIHKGLYEADPAMPFTRHYQVNLVSSRRTTDRPPVVTVTSASLANLLGRIDREVLQGGMAIRSDHLMIKPGALVDADGGYLILDAQDILAEPGAWAALLRTLKTGELEFTNTDYMGAFMPVQLRPESIPVDVKVVLVGDPQIYALLDAYESRFSSMFKVLVDFSDSMSRDADGFAAYGSVVRRLIEGDDLRHFSPEAVARLIEHGARIVAQPGRLSSRFGRVSDIAREASFLAVRNGDALVSAEDIRSAIASSRRRADLPARRFRRMLAERALKVEFAGSVVGQINGLAVTSSGPLTYGFPCRITASIGPGSAGAINIERESDLSGSVHTKGFLILGGLLRYLLRLRHPMAFSASIAFEQTYGGIDGDSASGAEFCCLISALTDLPLRQDLAMTGAIDQHGNILPIGAATEKIEGFYDACQAVEFTGTQGVIIPSSNLGELMLRDDVVEAIETGRFCVHAIDSIFDALSLFTGEPAGDFQSESYADGSVMKIASDRTHEYWKSASRWKDMT